MTHGHRLMFLVISAVLLLAACPPAYAQIAVAQPAEPTSQPATAPAYIPNETIRTMFKTWQALKGNTRKETQQKLVENIEIVLAMGLEAEKTYPDAPNLAEMYRIMLEASFDLINMQKRMDGLVISYDPAELDELFARYAKVLKEKHLDALGVKNSLRHVGQYTDVGKPFIATLTTLDGKTLTLPDDFKGKIVVIDFWATWCGPCVGQLPELKRFYDAYKKKDVVVIGISLDETKENVEKFLTGKGYDWIQTFDGGGWDTPAAARYGISGIPAIFVVDKEGNIHCDTHRDLRFTVNRLLRDPPTTTKPAEE